MIDLGDLLFCATSSKYFLICMCSHSIIIQGIGIIMNLQWMSMWTTFPIRKDIAEGPYRGWWTLLESSRRSYSRDIWFWVRKFEQKTKQKTHLYNNSNTLWNIAYAFLICKSLWGKKTPVKSVIKSVIKKEISMSVDTIFVITDLF